MTSEWQSVEHALGYLRRADTIPRRTEGEATLLEELPVATRRVLDLGTGDRRLLAPVPTAPPDATRVALDFWPPMPEKARARFAGDGRVRVVALDLDRPLPDLGTFDAVVSSAAIHHLTHERKRELYAEVWRVLRPGGVFANLEHVSSP